jgi:Type II CAAX prenyl endopeptidase Rce1-like
VLTPLDVSAPYAMLCASGQVMPRGQGRRCATDSQPHDSSWAGPWATVIAILVPSALVALADVTSANATLVSAVNTMIFGVVFGAAYALTGELALPIGLHFAWDFAQGFGLGRSGDAPGLGAFLVVGERDSGAGCGPDGLSPWRAGCWERQRWS